MLPFASLHRTQRRRPFGFTLIELLLVGVMLLVGTLLRALSGSSHHSNHDTNAVIAQSERDSDSVRAMLEAIALTPEGQARAATPWTGSFIRPVPGDITSGFGPRFHPVLHVRKLHTGVDFRAPVGTPVWAADGGVVVHAGWLEVYSYAVIIDHGGGVSTLYGHCSSLEVSSGQSISAGQVIARSGSTGYSTGPHLHFEKRVNGSPVPPF
jgi:murein DD-endopeptidase MepM/ murein hydrolase activator NlpD